MINLNIIKMELKRSFKAFLIWSLSMGAMMYLLVALYPIVVDMYKAIPAEYLEMFGGFPNDIIEYFGMEGAIMVLLMGTIYAAIIGFSAINREFQELSIDEVYTLPISRKTFYINKLSAVIIQIVGFILVNTIFIILGFITAGPMPNLVNFLAFMGMALVLLIMIGIFGFSLAVIVKRGVKVMASLIIPLPLYIIFFIYQLTDNKILSYLQYLTPFTFVDAMYLIQKEGSFSWITLITFSILTVFSLIYSLKFFKEKDLLS